MVVFMKKTRDWWKKFVKVTGLSDYSILLAKKNNPMEQENQIYRLTFDVDFPASIGESNALTEAESCCETYILPTVDEVLSRFDSYNIDIERIDLDLGIIGKDDIPRVLRNLLEEEIVKWLYKGSESKQISIRSEDPFEREKSLEPDWVSYLYTGILPWTYEDSAVQLSEQVRQDVFSHLEDDDWMMPLFVRLSKDDAAFYRFFNLLDVEAIKTVLSVPIFKRYVYHSVVYKDMDDMDKHELLALAYTWMKEIEKEEDEIQKRQDESSISGEEKLMQRRESEEEQRAEWLREVEDEEEREEAKKRKQSKKSEVSEERIAFDSEEEQQVVAKKNDAAIFEDRVEVFDEAVSAMKRQMMMGNEASENHCLVDDAGLVLLHPFLPALFERVGYLDKERKFINFATQERAVHLLRWLAGFEWPHLDYQLSLEKVLCDFPLTYPIDSEIELSDLEKEEGMQVLRSVCQYWKPLNNTSPEGLQGSFLQRQGSIAYEDNTWIVRVEGQALDILLDDLPWEISLLLLPWKEEMIMVEWQRE